MLQLSPPPVPSDHFHPAPHEPDDATSVALARLTAEVAADSAALTSRLAELGRLQALVVSTTAHEMRTPLTVMRVHADLLLADSGHLADHERASLEAIAGAVGRLQDASDRLVSELRVSSGGAEEALRSWLRLEPGSERTRPGTD